MRKQNACLGEVILGPKVMNLYVCLQGAISIVLAKEEPIGAFGMLTKWFLTTQPNLMPHGYEDMWRLGQGIACAEWLSKSLLNGAIAHGGC
jgi:hypothetical protein